MRAWVAGLVIAFLFVLPIAIIGHENISHGLSVALSWGAVICGGGTVFAIEHADELFPRRKR